MKDSELHSRLRLATRVGYKHIQGGNVPGGHNVLWDGRREPFITPMKECNAVPLRFSDVVVDIGAYVGTYAIRCARFPVKRVDAYEPTPSTAAVLAQTRLPNLRLFQAAVVGNGQTEVELFVSAGIGVTNSIVLSNRKAFALKVPAVRYEDAIRDATIVKIDVEGAEYQYPILSDTLRAIIIDFHPVAGTPWQSKAKEIITEIQAAKFTPVVSPDFSCGWTRAGAWVREVETSGEYEPMMRGEVCCGCGKGIAGHGRSLCSACWQSWLPRHREGYRCADA